MVRYQLSNEMNSYLNMQNWKSMTVEKMEAMYIERISVEHELNRVKHVNDQVLPVSITS